VRGLWSRLTGSYSKIRAQNELEAWRSHLRDREERESMIVRQLDERRHLQLSIRKQRETFALELFGIRQDIATYLRIQRGELPASELDDERPRQNKNHDKPLDRSRRDRRPDGPGFDPDF
jgi:hypothetical protein